MKFLSFLSLALTASAAAVNPVLKARAASPKPPTLTLLFSANLTIADPIVIGQTPFGEQVIVQVTGGAFSGPKLAGKVTTGLVTSTTGNPSTNRAYATYVLTTNDGANIVITERAAIPYVEVLFEAANGKYGYLNNVTAWATGTEVNGLISLNFWQLTP